LTPVPDTSPQHSLSKVGAERRTILTLAGEVDIANVGEITEAVREELASSPVMLDLSELSFIDSSGLRMLAHLVFDAQESGWALTIGRDMAAQVRRLLEMTGMLELLPLEGTQVSFEQA
jgi:anti-anti-sigma factor